MKKISKAIGGGGGAGIGALIAAAITAQFPTITPEMSTLIGTVCAIAGGFAVAYLMPKNQSPGLSK